MVSLVRTLPLWCWVQCLFAQGTTTRAVDAHQISYTHEWAIKFSSQLTGDALEAEANNVAAQFGLVSLGQTPHLERLYHFVLTTACEKEHHHHGPAHPCRRRRHILAPSLSSLEDAISGLPQVEFVKQQIALKRTHRIDDSIDRLHSRIVKRDDVHISASEDGESGDHVSIDKSPNWEDDELWNVPYSEVVRRVQGSEYAELHAKQCLPFDDELYPTSWHLHNHASHHDLGVMSLWQRGLNGSGIVVTVIDDGLERSHPDIEWNYDPNASWDLNDEDSDPTPRYDNSGKQNRHGTRCAGEIAGSAQNGVCSVGIAHGANIGGLRMLDGTITDVTEAAAIVYNLQHIDIYSSSWGPNDDGLTIEGPGPLAQEAFKTAVEQGRQGRGTLHVFASGNGGKFDNCNCDGYANSIYTLTFGAVGVDHETPHYMEPCTAMLAVTYSSGKRARHAIRTTDLNGGCTAKHSGTSAAAPIAAGVLALVLQANPNLTWRDVQHLVVRTSLRISNTHPSWTRNGAGYWVSPLHGFGLLQPERLVDSALQWETVPIQYTEAFPTVSVNKVIPDGGFVASVFTSPKSKVRFLEHVQVTVTLEHALRGSLGIFVISPCGTVSQLLSTRQRDRDNKQGLNQWTFMTLFHWGEVAEGDWLVWVNDTITDGYSGKFRSWSLTLYGTEMYPQISSGLHRHSDDRENSCVIQINPDLPVTLMAMLNKRIKMDTPMTERSDEDESVDNKSGSALIALSITGLTVLAVAITVISSVVILRQSSRMYKAIPTNQNFIMNNHNPEESSHITVEASRPGLALLPTTQTNQTSQYDKTKISALQHPLAYIFRTPSQILKIDDDDDDDDDEIDA